MCREHIMFFFFSSRRRHTRFSRDCSSDVCSSDLPSDRPATRPPVRLLRWPSPELSDGPHLSYAIQWFSFAVIIVVGSVALAKARVRDLAGRRQTGAPGLTQDG